jgi:hypothetical protein
MADVKAKKEDVKIEKPISSYCILNERVERPPTIQLTLGEFGTSAPRSNSKVPKQNTKREKKENGRFVD